MVARLTSVDLGDDPQRFPALGDAGQRMLAFLSEHPAAPRFRNRSGHKLTADDVASLRAFEDDVLAASAPAADEPAWLSAFVEQVFADVPWYRALGSPPHRFEDVAPVARADFAADIARFVPDTAPLERMIQFSTTGTTGHPLLIASHPVVAARYLAFHKRALARHGVTLEHRAGQVGVVLVGFQRRCFTYVSVTPAMDESGLAKINLHPDEWRAPGDRATYLDALAPEVFTGDPISFTALADLDFRHRAKALLSTSMSLLPGLRRRLQERFGCPVVDVYSMNEAGPIGVFVDDLRGHVLLQPRMFVEILDERGRRVADGERGEITLTGGFNFCLPLLRYRTGDFAALVRTSEGPVLQGLSGRPPVKFRRADGQWLNNIEVSHALGGLALPQFGVHQRADGGLVLRLSPTGMSRATEAQAILAALFGCEDVALETIEAEDKIVQYTSELSPVP